MDRMGLPSQYAHYSRRAFFGIAAAVVAAGAAACDTAARTVGRSGSSGKPGGQAGRTPSRGPVSENDLPGDPRWNIRHLGAPDAVVGYAGQASVLPGEPITVYVSTTARSFRVSAFRMGWYKGDEARLLWTSATIAGHRQRQPELVKPTNTVEARWDPSLTVPTHDWPEGSYLLRLDAEHGAQRFIPVTVRSATTAGKTVVKNATETWQAYNTWGGYDLYNGPGGVADYGNRSLAVSLDRPYDANGAYMFSTTSGRRSSWPSGPACRWPTSPAWTSMPIRTCWTGPTRCSPGATTSTGPRRSGRTSRRPGTRA